MEPVRNQDTTQKSKEKGMRRFSLGFIKKYWGRFLLLLCLVFLIGVAFFNQDFLKEWKGNLKSFQHETLVKQNANQNVGDLVQEKEKIKNQVALLQSEIDEIKEDQDQIFQDIAQLKAQQKSSKTAPQMVPDNIILWWFLLKNRIQQGKPFAHTLAIVLRYAKDSALHQQLQKLVPYQEGVGTAASLVLLLSKEEVKAQASHVRPGSGVLAKIKLKIENTIRIDDQSDHNLLALKNALKMGQLQQAQSLMDHGDFSVAIQKSSAWKKIKDFLAAHALLEHIDTQIGK